MKPENHKADRKDRRLLENRTSKRQCVVIMRERGGRSLPFVVRHEGAAVPMVRAHVGTLATIHADEGTGWDAFHAGWDAKRVNHSIAFKDDGACTNQAESFFSRLRRMEVGTHHHIAGKYLGIYARKASWREDNRRVDNGKLAWLALLQCVRELVASGRVNGSGRRRTNVGNALQAVLKVRTVPIWKSSRIPLFHSKMRLKRKLLDSSEK